ncbi:prohibitin family protein [uncultured Paraglaciecola sp.]|jgi:regulator of protease activity HflC (stomatin/prohibitin superfamily)|uniref:prohibitin family protein n=1 Tax=uncultured Paraglaciecola sp. TaxID=1765024 RepID=UPI0026374F05|nr:prohibitin family protein [uncultured Paraglaciecola sp.]|tara:strand:- start:233 stop:1096 length:864 start_codon:yes stop_codon:yes gene_type:complete
MQIFKTQIPIKTIVSAAVGLILLMGSIYTVNEGHIGIVKRFSEAKEQVNPGLHFKVPFIDSVEEIEVRTRKNEEKMASSTKEQMPVTVSVSVNWTVDKTAALELFRQYGGLTQFESRILDPRFRSATKDVIPQFDAEKLIQDRASAIQAIEANLIEEMKDFPVTVDNIQIENIQLPAKYLTSIETKQTEKNLAAAEEHKLARQNLEAQRDVNTAKAKADGIKLVAIAEAESIRIKGLAEAEAITAKAKALGDNPLIVKLTEAQNWDGKLPTTILGGQNMPILDMRTK